MLMKALFSVFLFASSQTFAAVYNCRSNSPKKSQFLDSVIKIECDLDSNAKPKLVLLAGSNKVALNQKATHVGADPTALYEKLTLVSLDGQVFDIHAATRMFTETAQASVFTIEPNQGSGFWVCYIED